MHPNCYFCGHLKLIFLILFILGSVGAIAQKVTITGKIIDGEGKGVPGVVILVDGMQGFFATTSEEGVFKLSLEPNKTYLIRSRFLGQESLLDKIDVESKDINIGNFELDSKTLKPIKIIGERRGDFVERLNTDMSRLPSTSGNGVADYIKLVGLGVNSNNELTSNYNVRGGNYDENLIYINGIQIYRPFLVRSGQQEGLSFVNSAMVHDIYFSAGGFDAYYGDKLSSVLDITYREPTRFAGSAQASLMGGQANLEGVFGNYRGNFIAGVRYRANSYVLSSLPTKGDYNPIFMDAQMLTNYYLNYSNENRYTKLFVLGHYAYNNYRFVPSTRNTTWGSVNEAYQLKVYYEGQEETKYHTFTAATGINWRANERFKMDFIGSVYHSIESEHFDILGEYWINQLETDPAKDEYGDSTSNVGVGGFLDHARNDLNVWIGNIYTTAKFDLRQREKELENGKYKRTFGEMRWGAKAQYEHFVDKLSEWHLIDSAGYSIPLGNPDVIELEELIKQNNQVETYRFTGHYQFSQNWITGKDKEVHLKKKVKTDSGKVLIDKHELIKGSPDKFSLTIGTRGGYRTYNNEHWITPRLSISYTPRSYVLNADSTITRRNVKFRFATGLYYQPPLYRTMRGILGQLSPSVVSQKSFHNVLGADIYFNMWGRPFKLVTEAYYKYMWDIVPYEIDNVRIRYYGRNSAVAYAYGFDAKIHGEFIPGVESSFRIGFLNTAENIKDDYYYLYLNSDGDTIINGYTVNNIAVDSIREEPGYIPRPTDQRVTFSLFFQDQMPRIPNFKVSVNTILGTPLPYGPPTYERYKDVLRSSPYLRVDLGFMYDFINPTTKRKMEMEEANGHSIKKGRKFFNSHFQQITVSLDAFNLFGINNTISYQWLQDIYGRYYAIPNHLTGRRINLRFIVKF